MQFGQWILFADLDGTVLDRVTYEPGVAMEALEWCQKAGIPVILNSSKTRAEMEFFYERFPILPGTPFISENGGGVFFPAEYWDNPPGAEKMGGYWKVTLGAEHTILLRILKNTVERLQLDVRLFSEMTLEEIAAMTGLPLEQAGLAREREFDEPFWFGEEKASGLETLEREILQQGMHLTRGGRCFHVHGKSDKGNAARFVLGLYREKVTEPFSSAGVGDAANDLPLFQEVDRAYLVQREDGSYDPAIPEGQGIVFLKGYGPLGFRKAVEDLRR